MNAGLGNTDIGLLPIKAVDLDRAILDFPRSKTATSRVVPLWPETVDAIRNVLVQVSHILRSIFTDPRRVASW